MDRELDLVVIGYILPDFVNSMVSPLFAADDSLVIHFTPGDILSFSVVGFLKVPICYLIFINEASTSET